VIKIAAEMLFFCSLLAVSGCHLWVIRYRGFDASASADVRYAANSDQEIKEHRLVVKGHKLRLRKGELAYCHA
jgi:hypothetical protein